MTDNFIAELGIYRKKVDTQLKKLQKQNFAEQLWKRDKTLWNTGSQPPLLGWLDVAEKTAQSLPEIEKFSAEVRESGFKYVVLLGMGGSSMSPMVFRQMPRKQGYPDFFTLDTSDPETVLKIENTVDITKTLFIVSSKSGSTVEVMALFDYFFDKIYRIRKDEAGENFIAITDAGTPLFQLAENKKFRKIFINFPGIGGRFSALSYVGIVPAALMGIEVGKILQRAHYMMKKCGPETPVDENPGIFLGVVLAELASLGCDKLTYLFPPGFEAFGLWLEQLLAESTGKAGKGIFPLNGVVLSQPDTYGRDRFFLKMGFSGEEENAQQKILYDLITRGCNPVIYFTIEDYADLAAEFYRWEIATITAGALMGVNPFDQPNVNESKIYTEELLEKAAAGKLPGMEPALKEGSITYYGPEKMENPKLLIEKFFSTTQPGSYICLLAYLPEEAGIRKRLSVIESLLQECFHVPVSVQFGPRYLHATGQYHKGGPATGYFIQFTCHRSVDVPIPGKPYTFGTLINAQAIGDMEALMKHERKVIQVDVGDDPAGGLDSFREVIEKITNGMLVI